LKKELPLLLKLFPDDKIFDVNMLNEPEHKAPIHQINDKNYLYNNDVISATEFSNIDNHANIRINSKNNKNNRKGQKNLHEKE